MLYISLHTIGTVYLYQFLTLMTKVLNTWRTSTLFQIQQITSAGLSRELWRFARSFHLDQWVVAIRSVTLEVARGLQESWSIPEMEIFTTNLMIARSRYDKVPMKDRFCFCTSGEVWGNFWKESVTPNSNSHLCNLMVLLTSVEECGSVCIALKAFTGETRHRSACHFYTFTPSNLTKTSWKINLWMLASLLPRLNHFTPWVIRPHFSPKLHIWSFRFAIATNCMVFLADGLPG